MFADAGYQAGRDQVDAALLDESIAAWRRLIAKANEDAPPERRAKFEHQMGNALTTVGQRHNRPASIEEGIEMYRRALHVRTRDAAPFDWATTMNSLGGALESIGRREAHSEHLEEAVGVYQSGT